MFQDVQHSLTDRYVDVPPGFDFDSELEDSDLRPCNVNNAGNSRLASYDCQLFGECIAYERLEVGLCVVLDGGVPRNQRYAQQGRLRELGYTFDTVTCCWWPEGMLVQCVDAKPPVSADVPPAARWNLRDAVRPFWAFAALGLVTGNIVVQLLH